MATVEAKCWRCGCSFLVEKKEQNRGSGKFCSLSCSAAYGNTLRKKARIGNNTCVYCGNKFYRKPSLIKTERVYCSKRCFYEATHPLYSKEQLLDVIRDFYKEKGRIPFHEEFNSNLT